MTTEAAMRRRFPVGLTVTVLVALGILISLGAWQLRRLEWKTTMLAGIEAARTAPVLPLAEALALQDPGFRRVEAYCPGLAGAPFVELHAIIDGQVGVRLISPCVTGDVTILVDRGFVADTVSARPPVEPWKGSVRLVGVLRRPEAQGAMTPQPSGGRWYARDIPSMAKALNVSDPAPVMLMAETSSNPDWAALRPVPLPLDIPNRHLGYALTWFGLAGVLVCIYAAMLSRRFKVR